VCEALYLDGGVALDPLLDLDGEGEGGGGYVPSFKVGVGVNK
jgi:hypothetical protein